MTSRPRALAATAALALTIGTAGCRADQDAVRAYATAPCPPDVSAVLVAEVICGYLTVPENRAKPGRTIRLLVTRIQPPAGTPRSEPVFRAGTDMAGTPNYAGTSPMAQRVRREVIILDARGTAHSEPSLDCPEVAALTDRTLAAPTDDPHTRAALLDAVGACHRRLTTAGIDLAAYNVTEMAADAEALRVALGVETWDVATSGTASRIALEMLRRTPEHIRAVLLDSPELPGADPRATAVDATRSALAAVLRLCAASPECERAFPDAEAALTGALAALDSRPATLTVRPNGRAVTVHFDAAMLLRVLRHMLSDGGSSGSFFTPGAVPRLLDAIVAGRLASLTSTLAAAFVGDLPYCVGYQPKCLQHHRQSLGVAYSVLCHDIAPFADPAIPGRVASAAKMPGFVGAFGHSPYLDICERWPVGAAAANVAELVRSDVPVLVAVGAFAPYAPEASVRAGLAGLSHVTFLVDPAGGHNVVPRTPCIDEIRNDWLDNPNQRPTLDCLRSLPIRWDLP
jgi:pimeloyl-ACP methyl ester carboxylesterase